MTLGQGYVFTVICDSVNGGVPHPLPPRSRQPPGADTPLGVEPTGAHPPWEQTPQEYTHPQTRHPPGADPPSWHPLGADSPGEQTPPRADTPPGSSPPPPLSRHPLPSMLWDTVNARAVRILLECNLVTVMTIKMLKVEKERTANCLTCFTVSDDAVKLVFFLIKMRIFNQIRRTRGKHWCMKYRLFRVPRSNKRLVI